MPNFIKVLSAASVTALFAGGAMAQDSAFTLNDVASDEVGDLQEQIQDDAERDFAFGNEGRQIGTAGSVALRYVQSDDRTGDDTISVGLGADYSIFDGVNGSEFNVSYVYASTNGTTDTDRLTVGYQYTRDFTPSIFGYVDATVRVDNEAEAGDNKVDGFLGFGAGYRILNTSATQWSVQAGPGYRYIDSFIDGDVDEAAYSVESNFYRSLTEGVYVTNDTQLIGSDSDTTITNDLALNVALSNALSLRTSVFSEFQGSDFDTLENDNNTYGLSVVYSFN